LITYAVSIAAAGLAEAAIWLYAIHIRALFSVLVVRRLEPPEPEPTTAERDDRPG
jgi:hypothetical protein